MLCPVLKQLASRELRLDKASAAPSCGVSGCCRMQVGGLLASAATGDALHKV